jgi:hypothetical protein
MLNVEWVGIWKEDRSMTISLFWAVTQCGLIGRYQRFGEARETMVSTYESTQRHSPEEQHRHLHRRENLKES